MRAVSWNVARRVSRLPQQAAALAQREPDLVALQEVTDCPSGERRSTGLAYLIQRRGRLRPERGIEWDEAELAVVPGLRELGYRDAFRELHGYAQREPSWTWRVIAGHAGGWRLDHLFTSRELHPHLAKYHHAWREEGLSDHSALEVDIGAHGSRRRVRPSSP